VNGDLCKIVPVCEFRNEAGPLAQQPTYEELQTKIKQLEKEAKQLIQAEKNLRQREERYKLVFEKASDAIFIVQDSLIKFANKKTEKALGYSKNELKKISIPDLIHPEDRDLVVTRHQKRLKGTKVPKTYSFRVLSRSGEELWVELNAIRVSWEGKPATLNFVRNITEKKKLDAQLQQAAKMEAIGTLAGGVAHAFNNLLMGIQGHTSLLLYDIDSAHPHYEALRLIEEEVQSGAQLTNQLMGYARKGRYRPQIININDVIKSTSETFGRTKKEITIHRSLTRNPYALEADQGQMEQMLLNLYINAADAMPGGGELILSTKNVSHQDIKNRLYEPKPGKYLRLTVADKGVGMDEETRERIFDPFFTTKKAGRGTGLGLAAVYGIVKSHDGYIDVKSIKGRGTSFNIYLPASAKIDQTD
jgi:two-component system cell cycle sensor histidine kinase/response regulator CckA